MKKTKKYDLIMLLRYYLQYSRKNFSLVNFMTHSEIDPMKEEMELWPSKPLVDLQSPFVDQRGSIQPLVDLMMKSAVMIESKAGSLRANHYHKTDWHYYVSGKIEYFHRKLNSSSQIDNS